VSILKGALLVNVKAVGRDKSAKRTQMSVRWTNLVRMVELALISLAGIDVIACLDTQATDAKSTSTNVPAVRVSTGARVPTVSTGILVFVPPSLMDQPVFVPKDTRARIVQRKSMLVRLLLAKMEQLV